MIGNKENKDGCGQKSSYRLLRLGQLMSVSDQRFPINLFINCIILEIDKRMKCQIKFMFFAY